MVGRMHARGFKVFLDLKVHDIPFQVKGAVHSSLSGAGILSIHGTGIAQMISAGPRVQKRLQQSVALIVGRTKLVTISVLTSWMNALLHWHVIGSIKDEVARWRLFLITLVPRGIVCSPPGSTGDERKLWDKYAHRDPRSTSEGAGGDQVRISTPSAAIKAG